MEDKILIGSVLVIISMIAWATAGFILGRIAPKLRGWFIPVFALIGLIFSLSIRWLWGASVREVVLTFIGYLIWGFAANYSSRISADKTNR